MTNETATIDSEAVIEDIGPSRKKITITIPADAVTEHIRSTLDSLATDAQLPGFRPGRAPRNLIEKRFGGAVREEARSRLIAGAYQKAIQDNNLSVLGEPVADQELDEITVEEGEPITFSVEVEVPPEFDLPELEGIEVKKPIVEVRDEHVDAQLGRMLKSSGELQSLEEAGPGDYCIGHGIMNNAEGERILDVESAVIQIPEKDSDGRGAILGVMVEDFAKQVGSPKPGDELTVKTRGPQSHEDERIRDKDLAITFKVERCERIIPASPEELVEKYGLQDENQLREILTLRLNQRALLETQTAMRQQVANHLLENVEMELPERVTERQSARNLERQRMEMMYRGVDQQTIEQRIAELRDQTHEQAVRELKLTFILSRIAEDMGIQVNEDEVNGRIAQIAQERGVRPDKLKNDLIERNQIMMIAQQVREHKTLDAIIAKANINEMPVDEYNVAVHGSPDPNVGVDLGS